MELCNVKMTTLTVPAFNSKFLMKIETLTDITHTDIAATYFNNHAINMKTSIQAQPNWTLPPRSNANESLHDCLARIDTIYEFAVNAERGMQANMANFAQIAGV